MKGSFAAANCASNLIEFLPLNRKKNLVNTNDLVCLFIIFYKDSIFLTVSLFADIITFPVFISSIQVVESLAMLVNFISQQQTKKYILVKCASFFLYK